MAEQEKDRLLLQLAYEEYPYRKVNIDGREYDGNKLLRDAFIKGYLRKQSFQINSEDVDDWFYGTVSRLEDDNFFIEIQGGVGIDVWGTGLKYQDGDEIIVSFSKV